MAILRNRIIDHLRQASRTVNLSNLVDDDWLEHPLELGEHVALRLHLMMCTGCSSYREQLGTLRQAMRAYAEGKAATDGPPPEGHG